MEKLWSAVTQRLEPYVPGEQPQDRQFIKLNTNENPYPPSPRALEAIHAAAGDGLRLYPDPEALKLRRAIAQRHGLGIEEVFAGNGSDEVLALAFQAFFDPSRTLLFPDITYSFYPVFCGLFGIPYREVPLDEGLCIRVEDYLQPSGGVIFPNPNAPTAQALAVQDILRILEADPDRVVVVDEAYVMFGAESMVPYIRDYPNLLVITTLSKSHALAGLRGGYAMGQAHLIEGLTRVKDSFNSYPLDRLALAGAQAAIEDEAYTKEQTLKVMATRERFADAIGAMGFKVLPSRANFVFAAPPDGVSGQEMFAALRERGILVRRFTKARIDNYLRITIGTEEEMEKVLRAITEILAQRA